jgi:hypothetical protein
MKRQVSIRLRGEQVKWLEGLMEETGLGMGGQVKAVIDWAILFEGGDGYKYEAEEEGGIGEGKKVKYKAPAEGGY